MAMRLYSKADFEQALRDMGLSPTPSKTERSVIWVNDDGDVYSVPYGRDYYPDYILDEIKRHIQQDSGQAQHLEAKIYKINIRYPPRPRGSSKPLQIVTACPQHRHRLLPPLLWRFHKNIINYL